MAADAPVVDAGLLDDEPDATHDVALSNIGETERNTIVLGGVDVVIPLELDMDGDPFQDDAVCLCSVGGHWEDVRLSSDPEVTASRDKRHLYYEFQDVPSGVYHVDVRIGDQWTTVLRGLLVSRGVARLGDRTLGEEPPADDAAVDDPHVLVDRDQPEPGAPPPSADGDDECGA
jgi:hypothetical protein